MAHRLRLVGFTMTDKEVLTATWVGKHINRYTVLDVERRHYPNRTRVWLKVQCDCGNIVWKSADHARRDLSCGCMKYQKGHYKTNIMQHIGETYGDTKIIDMRRVDNSNNCAVIEALVQCSCGNISWVNYSNFRGGHYQSCGCKRYSLIGAKKRTHGDAHKRLYNIHRGIIDRCYNPKIERYQSYGARGITVCKEWLESYVVFREWALSHGYDDTLTIDRIDINGNYCPENCRWATTKQQAQNTTRTHWVERKGVRKSLAEWCEEEGVSQSTVHGRLNIGWDIERALTTPVRKLCRK